MKAIRSAVITLLLFSMASCIALAQDISQQQLIDPHESFNRKVFAFNQTADKYLLKPAAKGYKNVVPGTVKTGVGNFFNNLKEPLNVLNNLLQGKTDRALVSTYRFTVNSTLGILGLIDVAEKYDVHDADEDFGQTLAAWGVKPGPYLMLPFFGPSNLRDGTGRLIDRLIFNPFDEITDSSSQEWTLFGVNEIDLRHSLLGTGDVLDSQLDPYTFLRSVYQQNRIKVIYDDNPPATESDDFNDF